MLKPESAALILAPMQGVTDAPMRALQGETGAFTFAVSEFLRVSQEAAPKKLFLRHVPELRNGAVTPSGLPVQVQLLGGDAALMALSAQTACACGARAIDINFGCPAPTVNRHDGGATLLKYPDRVRDIVRAVRDAVPAHIPVSAKMRLGWDTIDAIHENADRAQEGGADWITIHGRTRVAGYAPPIYWNPIGQVRQRLAIPVVANGDIWTLDDFLRCRDMTGCRHYMLGRGALANPRLPAQIAHELGLAASPAPACAFAPADWIPLLQRLVDLMAFYGERVPAHATLRVKQWLRMASHHGDFHHFDAIKRAQTLPELFAILRDITAGGMIHDMDDADNVTDGQLAAR